MEDIRWTDRLAKFTIYAVVIVIICAVLWYFKNVVIYVLVAGVLSLIGKPLSDVIRRIHIKKRYIPDWAVALCTLIVIFGVFVAIVTLIVPIVTSLVKEISAMNVSESVKFISVPLEEINNSLIKYFPNLGNDFKIEMVVTEELQKLFNVSVFSSVISSVTSFIAGVGVALFSIVFISFFFFKDQSQFSRIIAAIVPDRSEKEAVKVIDDLQTLLTRYFLGLILEVFGVAVVNCLGLSLITGLGFNVSASIAILVGLANIVPYIGPIVGGAGGVIVAVLVKYSAATPIGLNVSFWAFVLILIGIFCFTQIIDNYVFQPLIYSNSVHVHPLEIFIVFLMAGQIGGVLGMLVAIPCYTAIRLIAGRFLSRVKFVRRLTGKGQPDETPPNDDKSAENNDL